MSAPDPPTRDAVERDLPTLLTLAVLGYLLAVALHEHGGHSLACMALGGTIRAAGAFYVDCDNARMSALATRMVALAGPIVSALLGFLGFALLRRASSSATSTRFLFWLIGSLGLMEASGYLLFSGASGLGDLGTTADGALYQLLPEVVARVLLFAGGVVLYRASLQRMRARWAASFGEPDRAASGRALTGLCYGAGAALYIGLGLLKPDGLEILLTSVLPSSLGGTCGLLVMWNLRSGRGSAWGTPTGMVFRLARTPGWWVAALLATVAYALAFASQ